MPRMRPISPGQYFPGGGGPPGFAGPGGEAPLSLPRELLVREAAPPVVRQEMEEQEREILSRVRLQPGLLRPISVIAEIVDQPAMPRDRKIAAIRQLRDYAHGQGYRPGPLSQEAVGELVGKSQPVGPRTQCQVLLPGCDIVMYPDPWEIADYWGYELDYFIR